MKIRVTDARRNTSNGIDCTLQLHGQPVAVCHSDGEGHPLRIEAELGVGADAIRHAQAQARATGETLEAIITRKALRTLSPARIH